MQLAGDEKKIQALFSELAREEAQAAPRFEKLWREVSLTQPAPSLSRALVVFAATLLVAVAVLFAAWSNSKTPVEQNAQTAPPPPIPNQPSPQKPEPDNKAAVVQRRTQSHSTRRRSLARHQRSDRALEQRALQQQAALLANWKSPTENFMTSPTLSGFNSLPQLNESVKDLQSFLQTKESNQ